MIKIHYLLPLAIIALLTGAALLWQADPDAKEQGNQTSGELRVSNDGSMMNTNVEAGSLQQAAPPENSATSAETNPQQAMPNYCQPGEQPIIDGCVAQ
jgi:hypothetical protein